MDQQSASASFSQFQNLAAAFAKTAQFSESPDYDNQNNELPPVEIKQEKPDNDYAEERETFVPEMHGIPGTDASPLDDPRPSREELLSMNAVQLYSLCKERGLTPGPKIKESLVNRIFTQWHKKRSPSVKLGKSKPVYCCVPGCTNNSFLDGVRMHRIPTSRQKEATRKAWIANLQSVRSNLILSQGTRVCSGHFHPADYEANGNLKVDAAPTVFLTKGRNNSKRTKKQHNSPEPVEISPMASMDGSTNEGSFIEGGEKSNTNSDDNDVGHAQIDQISNFSQFQNLAAAFAREASCSGDPVHLEDTEEEAEEMPPQVEDREIPTEKVDIKEEKEESCTTSQNMSQSQSDGSSNTGNDVETINSENKEGEKEGGTSEEAKLQQFQNLAAAFAKNLASSFGDSNLFPNVKKEKEDEIRPTKSGKVPKGGKSSTSKTSPAPRRVYPHNGLLTDSSKDSWPPINLKPPVEKPFSCSVCGQGFTEKSNLLKHEKIHTGQVSYTCSVCGKGFIRKDSWTAHMRMHSGDRPFICKVCGKGFTLQYKLTKHEKIHTQQTLFICNVCGKGFTRQDNWTRHMKGHIGEKLHECHICSKTFKEESQLERHLMAHRGEKPHICVECGKGFDKHAQLITHMRIHSGEKPFECPICSRGFAQLCNMQAHVRIHTNERPHSCSECGKGFHKQDHLTAHMRIHSGERPFSCPVCKKCFSRQDYVAKHMRLHSGEKPYGCDVCKQEFSQRSHLTVHMRKHSGETPYACAICGNTYKHKSSLNEHMRNHSEMNQFMASLPLPFQNLGQPSDLKVPSLSQFPFFNSSDFKFPSLDLPGFPTEGLPEGFVPPLEIKQEAPDDHEDESNDASKNAESSNNSNDNSLNNEDDDDYDNDEQEMEDSELDNTKDMDNSGDNSRDMDSSRDMDCSRDMDSSKDIDYSRDMDRSRDMENARDLDNSRDLDDSGDNSEVEDPSEMDND